MPITERPPSPSHQGRGNPPVVQRAVTVAMLVAGRDIRILNDAGELIRQLTLDPNRDYQPQG